MRIEPAHRPRTLPRPAAPGAALALLLALLLAPHCAPRAQADEVQRITAAGEQAVLKDSAVKPIGAVHPDVVIVEYFDYNCPYCKRLGPTLQALLRRDSRVAILYKDWPILGPQSAYAARAALAANWQGKYRQAHDALLAAPHITAEDQVEQVETVLAKAGIDIPTLRRDLAAHAQDIAAILARNDREADQLELKGTPGILVGRLLAPGAPAGDELDRLIAAARQSATHR